MKTLAKAAAALLVAASAIAPVTANAASASFIFSVGDQGRYDNYIGNQCRVHPDWRGCYDWRHNHGHWGRNDYQNWYLWNRPSLGSIGAGIFGFAIGAALANGMNNSSNSDRGQYSDSEWNRHVQLCEDHYRSYSAETDQFLGYDGNHHYCTL
jgi:hypothetical protein